MEQIEVGATIVVGLEQELLEAYQQKDDLKVSCLLDPHFREVGSSGKEWSRESIIKFTHQSPAEIRCWDFRTQGIDENSFLVTYKTQRKEGPIVLRSSIWRLNSLGWQMLYHQGTVAS